MIEIAAPTDVVIIGDQLVEQAQEAGVEIGPDGLSVGVDDDGDPVLRIDADESDRATLEAVVTAYEPEPVTPVVGIEERLVDLELAATGDAAARARIDARNRGRRPT